MKVAVIGSGYVGLVTGTCLAEAGNHVTCVDIDADKVKALKAGKITIYEPGLDVYFKRNTEEGRLKFTTRYNGVGDADVVFMALPTPPGEDGSADLQYVLAAAKSLAKTLKGRTVVVDKSTVPVGTAEIVATEIKKHTTAKFDVVSNPEFLREGFAVEDFMKPERIVVGVNTQRAREVMEELYAPFIRQGNPIYFMDARSAELCKYAANSFLATKISFMNEIANLCELLDADVDQVRLAMGADSRIGKRFLFPGIGYGGSCFPKDVRALHKTANEHDYDLRILDAVMEVNENQRDILPTKISRHFDDKLEGKKIAVWGLAFKPDTDDMREAPAITIIEALLGEGAEVVAYDPEASANAKKLFGKRIGLASDAYSALDEADALVICTEWSEFRSPDFELIKKQLNKAVIFDGRNLYRPEQMKKLGFKYYSIGRKDA